MTRTSWWQNEERPPDPHREAYPVKRRNTRTERTAGAILREGLGRNFGRGSAHVLIATTQPFGRLAVRYHGYRP